MTTIERSFLNSKPSLCQKNFNERIESFIINRLYHVKHFSSAMFLPLITIGDVKWHQLHVKTAFLNEDLD